MQRKEQNCENPNIFELGVIIDTDKFLIKNTIVRLLLNK